MSEGGLTTEKLHTAIMGNNWGMRISKDESFYRLMFKLERQGQTVKIKNEDMHLLFASYKIWHEKTLELLGACNSESEGDKEARILGEKFKKDILEHTHTIVMGSMAETEDWCTKLTVMADMIAESNKNKMEA